MEQWLQHTSECKYDPAKGAVRYGLQGQENPCTCGLDEYITLLKACKKIPSNMTIMEGQIDKADMHCRIRTATKEDKEKAMKLLLWLGKPAAERLLEQPIFEIRKYESGHMEMTHCAVVCCSRGILWAIPRNILERVVVG